MNEFCAAYHSERGTTHPVNQDSIFLRSFASPERRVLAAGLFDGMGGHSEGERVSGAAAQALSQWAAANRALLLAGQERQLTESLKAELDRLNEKVCAFAARVGIETGATAAVLLLWQDRYLCCNVGDSRVYRLAKSGAQQLTEDHSLVAGLVRAGLLSEEEAQGHPQKNVLTQALGVLEKLSPSFRSGKYEPGDAFLLCCDGFYHELTPQELGALGALEADRGLMGERLRRAAELAMARGETDNITAILVKTKNA